MKSACNIAKSVHYNLKKYRIAFIKSYHESYSINGLHKNTPKFLKVEFAKLDIRIKGKSILKNEEIVKNYFEGLNLCYKYYQDDFLPDFSIKEKEILKSIKELHTRLTLSYNGNPWYCFNVLKVIIDKYPIFFKMKKVQHFIISYKYYLNKFNENNKPKVYIKPTYTIGSNHWSSISRIKVTDTITNKEFIFENTNDKELLKMFSPSCISRAIITGKITKVNKLSKYKNQCFISRII